MKIFNTITEEEEQNQSGTDNWKREKARIDKAMLTRYFDDSEQKNSVFYVCGPPAMIKAMQDLSCKISKSQKTKSGIVYRILSKTQGYYDMDNAPVDVRHYNGSVNRDRCNNYQFKIN